MIMSQSTEDQKIRCGVRPLPLAIIFFFLLVAMGDKEKFAAAETEYFYRHYYTPWFTLQSEGEAYCNTKGGWLGTIRNAADLAQLQEQYGATPPWTTMMFGGSDSMVEGTWYWKYGPPEIQGTAINYTNWNSGEPDGATGVALV